MAREFAAFSKEEHDGRMARARALMREQKFACCIVMAPENLYYLAGYESWVSVNSPQALIFTAEEAEPTLILRNVDLSLALETSWVKDIRSYHLHTENFAARVAGILEEKGVTDGRVAIELQSYALPYALGQELAAAMAPIQLVDATVALGDLRLAKSPREMQYIAQAAAFTNIGLKAAREALKPGITEIGLAAAIEGALRHAGSDYWAIPTELASGKRTPGGHAAPRGKPIEPGDLVHIEFAGVSNRYHTTALQTLALGDPGPRARELYDIALQSLKAGIAAVKPGVPVAAAEEASLVPLRKHGLEHTAMMRFGYGIGIAYPPIWLETLQISRGFSRRFETGMVFVLHSCIELVEEGIGIIQGGTYHLTDAGPRMLVGAGDSPLVIV
ncbi:MAG TPA: Xaa-Pro peptidase family protein [Hypericibacter adhaerens]|uniref:M24 family metallopeptidase n=1 Tax=Hypericibacter adhaerens TaxID=2602016 RepID=UPI002CACF829|nr:Xaa-Pro peptidase family protein [Hypericibacter adhaerens]HWA43648.1 Xaa-Pro peptidase family protein [Hypericibacter adhaerens]